MTQSDIPRLSAKALSDAAHPDHGAAREALAHAVRQVGFLTLYDTGLSAARVETVLDMYRRFFALPEKVKSQWDMAVTGSNRGWGASGAEQVDPASNPDYKQVFDSGYHWPQSDLPAYGPNLWPDQPAGFRQTLEAYYDDALAVSRRLLTVIAEVIGADPGYFSDRFDHPMALLRGNYYPQRPEWAGESDFGIAPHTDYGCLTLLATDGSPGLEVRRRGGGWVPLAVPPGEFAINFGDMLQMWSAGAVIATPHRVIGSQSERISVPLFVNPRADTNVAPQRSEPVLAGSYLQRRFDETYLHLQD